MYLKEIAIGIMANTIALVCHANCADDLAKLQHQEVISDEQVHQALSAAVPLWREAQRQGKLGNSDEVVQIDASIGHETWYRNRQKNVDLKGKPNPKPLKNKYLKGESVEAFYGNAVAKYPGVFLENGQIKQDINRPVDQIIPELNEQLNGSLARQKATAVENAYRSGRTLDLALVEEMAAITHDYWITNNLWEITTAADLSTSLKQRLREDLGFDIDNLKGQGKDPGGEIYSLPLEKVLTFVRNLDPNILETLPAKNRETLSQFHHYRDLSRAEQLRDIDKVMFTVVTFLKTMSLRPEPIAQQDLNKQFSAVVKFEKFRKAPIAALEIPPDPVHTLPPYILERLGSADKILENKGLVDYLSGRKYILLNYFVDENGIAVSDFYPVSQESFSKAGYIPVSIDSVRVENPLLYNNLSPIISGRSKLIYLQKPGVIEMARSTVLGFPDQVELHVMGGLKTPTIQIKPANKYSYFARGPFGIYMVNIDSQGHPIGHFPSK